MGMTRGSTTGAIVGARSEGGAVAGLADCTVGDATVGLAVGALYRMLMDMDMLMLLSHWLLLLLLL